MSNSIKPHGLFTVALAAAFSVLGTSGGARAEGPTDPESNGGGSPSLDQSRSETLFSSRTTYGGYGGPEIKGTSVLGGPAIVVGGQGGFIIDHRLVLGAAGYGIATQHDVPVETQINGHPSTLEMGYGGFRAAYVFWPERVVHFDVAVLVGGGGLVVRTNNRVATSQGDRYQVGHDDAFFALEPAFEVEVNVTRFMRIAASASYRYLSSVDAPGLSYSDLCMPAGGVAFRFGKF